MKHLLPIFLLVWAAQAFGQEPLDSAFWDAEMEDSVSAMAIKPLDPSQTKKLLKQIIKRFNQDLKQKHEVGKYRTDATFIRETLAPFSVSRIESLKPGIAPHNPDNDFQLFLLPKFNYEGPYELTYRDSLYISHYLNTFPRICPNYLPTVPHLYNTIRGHIDKGPLLPFEEFSETMYYYKVTAYSIFDAAGRSVYRFTFARNGVKRYGKDVVYGKKYDVGELVGTAYFDSQSLRILQFNGKGRVPTEDHVINIRFQNDYDEDNGSPALRQTKLVWEAKGTKIKATVQRIPE
ncbi:MAG: hypothetical protein IKU02_10150 [Bacteroidaceae bacterium]|nr:hypothetical protein [Bacteroidaceae bacterium]